MFWLWLILFFAISFMLLYRRASLVVSTIALGLLLFFLTFLGKPHPITVSILWVLFFAIFVPLNIYPLRRWFISQRILSIFRRLMPKISETEEEALTAGSAGWTSDLFSGMPDWYKLRSMPVSKMSAEEQAFLDGPVEKLCAMIDGWTISRTMNIPQNIWDYLKREGFFGLIIPKEYGGKEFSATAHSMILMKVATASTAVATVIAVPNSLGPAELILMYGTLEQKNYYLPRLARGEEIPCFALTSPVAGSDASSIVDEGTVCKAIFDGQERLCIRLNWDKRYITLAPVASLLGLAFKLYDPLHLLGEKEKRGITCALVPTQLPGIEIGRRHYPLDCAFPNGPTRGKDVLIPVDSIIGGAEMAGHGWKMLMECLAAGRSISLPSMSTGAARKAAVATGSYARIRRQFKMPIGYFGGVLEALARITKNIYIVEALRKFTISALDQQQKPAVASAISKYHTTELGRSISRDAMDIHGGKGICMGPNNYLAQGHIELPISITVEGANILTRCMIIFGQGAIRCHPYILDEITAVQNPDKKQGIKDFDRALFGHLGFLMSNIVRAFWLGITNAHFVKVPSSSLKRCYQLATRFSAVLALLADVAMLSLGGELKKLEKISARLGDLLSYLYMGSAVIQYYESLPESEKNPDELKLVNYVCKDLASHYNSHLHLLLHNFPNRFLARILKWITLPLGNRCSLPQDQESEMVGKLLLQPNSFRERLKKDLYFSPHDNNPVGFLETVLRAVIEVEPLEKKLEAAERHHTISGKNFKEHVEAAVIANILTRDEAEKLLEVDALRMRAIHVDDFAEEDFLVKNENKRLVIGLQT